MARDNLRGIGLMILSMAGLAMVDMFVKLLSPFLSVAMILIWSGFGASIVFGAWARSQGHKVISRDVLLRPVIVRNLFEMVGTVLLVIAVANTPLSVFTSIFQAVPLLVTLGAAVFLRAPVGWRRWTAIFVGLAGVLIIIRPGSAEFDIYTLVSIGAVITLAGRDLTTRLVPSHVASTQIATWGTAFVGLGGVLYLPFTAPSGPITPTVALLLLGSVGSVLGGIYCLTAAMRVGEISAVSPFRYSRIIFGLLIAIVVFGERPDLWTLVGATIVVGSGLYTFWRETKAL